MKKDYEKAIKKPYDIRKQEWTKKLGGDKPCPK